MKKIIFLLALLLTILSLLLPFFLFKQDDTYAVIVAYDPKELKDSSSLNAYVSVLQELKVPYKVENIYRLVSNDPKILIRNHPAIILPDFVNKIIPDETEKFLEEYVNLGGNLFASFDVGTMNFNFTYKNRGTIAKIIGINNINYGKYKDNAFVKGSLLIPKEFRDLLDIPSYKLSNNALLSGYAYGELNYSSPRTEYTDTRDVKVLAYLMTKEEEKLPAIVLRNATGNIMYVSLPLGYLKAYADDFPLRTFLSVFLFKIAKVPHILATPYGLPLITFNLHVDSNIDYKSIPYLMKKGFLNKNLPYSIHICAGDFRDVPNDRLGFDACGKGKTFVEILKAYGVIGSHGGWAHNYFSSLLDRNMLTEDEIKDYIDKNKRCLESIVGYKIREYSAPNGVHPEIVTKILEKDGFNSYYYTGDNGSSPNRTFLNGHMVSSKVIAFPITSFGKYASLYEMYRGGVSEEEVKNFFDELIGYTIKTKSARLFYSHPYDFPLYPNALQYFISKLITLQQTNALSVQPMSAYADFFKKLIDANFYIDMKKKVIEISGEELKGFVIALPKQFQLKSNLPYIKISADKDYSYITIENSMKKISIQFDFVK